MEAVIPTRRQWLNYLAACGACGALQAARKEFWQAKDAAAWTADEKRILLNQSPWAREGFARMEVQKNRPSPGQGSEAQPGAGMPDMRPGATPGGVRSVPLGGAPPPPVPNPDPGHPIDFRVLARWETAEPVRLAGGPETPELTGQFYVIRIEGLPLMPPPKAKPGEPAPNPNERMLRAIEAGSRLERRDKPDIRCARLFTGSGDAAGDVLLFFPRGADPVVAADKTVTLESWFDVFHLSVKFPLKEMMYKGELAL